MIIVSGLPGSGKTHLASRLASKLGAEYISSDLTRKEIESRGEYAFEDNLTVYEEMARRAGDELRHGNTVVIDATFYLREMRSLFSTLAALLHKKVCNIELFADKNLIRQRLSQPRLHSHADYAVYEQLVSQYESPEGEHLTLESTDDNIDDLLMQAESYVQDAPEG